MKKFVYTLSFFLLAACSTSTFFKDPGNLKVSEEGKLLTTKGPYQVYLNPGELIIAAEFPRSTQAFIKYWPISRPQEQKTIDMVNSWEYIYYAHLKNLEPSETYRFAVCVGELSCDFFKGNAGVKKEEPFKFLVIADSRARNQNPHDRLIRLMAERDANFYMHLGDMVTFGESVSEWNKFFKIEKPLYQKMPLVPVIGNHDLSRRNIFRRLFMPMSKKVRPPRYFSFSYGNTFFIAVDTNQRIPVGGTQYRFIESELKKAKDQGFKNILMVAHHPPFSSGWHGSNKSLHSSIVVLAEKYGVRAFLAGHDHHYERSKKIKGVTYVVTGGGGSTLRDLRQRDFTAKAQKVYQYVEIAVEGEKIIMRSYDIQNQLIDEAEL